MSLEKHLLSIERPLGSLDGNVFTILKTKTLICFICARASLEQKLIWSNNTEAAFISKGFSNWKNATAKFDSHDGSKCHKEAMMRIV